MNDLETSTSPTLQSSTPPIKSREWWRTACKDLTFFNSNIMPMCWDDKFHDFGEIHAKICHHLDPYYQKNSQIWFSAHRGSGKSTQLMGFMVWWMVHAIVNGKSDAMIYNTATKENAWNMSADIKHSLLNNEFLQWLYPEIPRQENSWHDMTKNRIQYRHIKLDFSSLETTLVSRHYPKWINDDLENDINAKSEYARTELIKTWKYQKAILTKIKGRNTGIEIEVGTPYHVNGLTWMIRKMKGFSKIEIPCYIDRDKYKGVWYKELYTVEDFEQKRDVMGTAIFCTPAETPILMADWSLKKIVDVKVGDEVVGFTVGIGMKGKYVKTMVKNVFKGEDLVYNVEMESGGKLRCNREHKWFSGRLEELKNKKSSHHKLYKKIRSKTNLIRLLDITEEKDLAKLKAWAYLGGIVDGEGGCKHSGIFISQNKKANPEVYKKIKQTLDFLEIQYTEGTSIRNNVHKDQIDGHLIVTGESNYFYLKGGRQLYFDLIRYSNLAKTRQLQDKMWKHNGFANRKDKTGELIPEKTRSVYGLETGTGNYIAWGCLSQNSAQYLLQPLSEEDALCPETWIRYWDTLPDVRWRSMVVDPGGPDSGKSDATGITICDTDEFGNIYVVYAEEHFVTPMKFCDLIVGLKERYDVDDCRIEKERFSTTVADLFRHRFPLFNISFVEHKGRSKGSASVRGDSRIWRLRQWFESKRIFIGRNQKSFQDQVLTFPQPTTGRDDMIDSLAYQLDIRRIPKRKSKLILPSGREWEPNVEASFEIEMDKVLANAQAKREGANNDSSY
jgi:hypothetical protein